MFVKGIAVTNFKSFRHLELDHLGRFSVLIGTNASGKSNFIQIFRFLRDIANHGLANAVSMQGGTDFLRNMNLPRDAQCHIRIVYDPGLTLTREKNGRQITVRYVESSYEFALRFPAGEGLGIVKDRLVKHMEFFDGSKAEKHGIPLGNGTSILANIDGEIRYELDIPKAVPLEAKDIFPSFLGDERIGKDALLIETPFFGFVHRLDRFFDQVAIYDFDPRLPKHSVSIMGKTDLEEDGSNLAIAIKNILEDGEKKRKLSNLVKDLLPFIGDVEIEKISDNSLLFKLQELYSKGAYVPQSFISDGTLNIIALIIALYFEKNSLIIIEEPERSIHPRLISKLVAMMKEVAQKKQIIITTHHPDIVRCAELPNILLLSRDKEGSSTIFKPGEKEEIKIFLKNEVGIDDLFNNDLLGL